ncbi:Zinc finger and BTB domain-containing protein 40 [Folsomia candida]|uniref:Zinc finger and BTB domain-containing protein 40 n=1 Tax=Folsomia candida TaxID=158441 RepID=A0A226DVS2_FOLCA|nr:Zinc finger and BTB domain-containing protein 40 [Folsomia candida]
MSHSQRVCLFCRKITCQSTDCRCALDYVPLFLTYLKTININKYCLDNFPRTEFHSCDECGSLLGTISQLVQKLGQELRKIYKVTLENLSEDGGNVLLEKLRRQIVSDDTEIKGYVTVKLKEEEHDLTEDEDEVTVKMEIEEGEVKVEIGDEFIIPNIGEDPLLLDEDRGVIEGNYLQRKDELDPLGPRPPKRSRLSSEEEHSTKLCDISRTELKKINKVKKGSSKNKVGSKTEPPVVNETLPHVNATSELKCDYCNVTTGLIFPCMQPSCAARFPTRDLLRLHRSGSHCVIKCDHCELTFTSAESLTQHKSEFHQKCEICGLLFLRSNFPHHVEKCREVSGKIGAANSVRVAKHISATGVITYDCGECNVKKLGERELLLHIRENHAEQQSFKCPACESASSSQAALELHYRKLHMHSMPNGKLCTTCYSFFTSQEALDYHVLLEHKNVPSTSNCRQEKVVYPADQRTIEKCKFCGKHVLGSMKNILEHETRCRHEVKSWGK